MGFWTPNTDRRGRIICAVMALAFAFAAFIAHRRGIGWLAVILSISALVGFVEVARGLCVLQACKIETRF